MGLDFRKYSILPPSSKFDTYVTYQIVEGVITIAFGIIGWFCLPGFPDQNTFLSPEQTSFVLQLVEKDRGDSVPDVLTKEKLVQHLLDWKLWAFGMVLSADMFFTANESYVGPCRCDVHVFDSPGLCDKVHIFRLPL